MRLEMRRAIFATSKRGQASASIIGRLDRIPVWSLPTLFLGIIGAGYLFTFYDIFDINVSFIQTCTQIVPGCTPATAGQYLGAPVLLNLLGYVLGTLVLSPLADRYGRRTLLVITLLITAIGSLYTAFAGDYLNFIIGRTVTGIGIGADLSIVNTYVNEMAPRSGRAKYASLIFIMSALGAVVAIWLGLYLTTPATSFPLGLPFALAGPGFETGWHIMYVIGGLLAVIGLVIRYELPESARWLLSRGRIEEAERVVATMEALATKHIAQLPPPVQELPGLPHAGRSPYLEILSNAMYVKRTILLLVIWMTSYITVYSIAAGLTTLLVALGYPPPEAGLIGAIGTFGFVASALTAYCFCELLERKLWLPLASVLTLIGGVMIALSQANIVLAAAGSLVLFFGFNLWVPVTYAWSVENYPTRARATGFALGDGVGHIGGGIGVSFIGSLTLRLGPLATFLLIGGFLVVAACLAQFGPATRQRRLDEVSP